MNYNYMALFLSIVFGWSPEQSFGFIDADVKCDKGELMKMVYQRNKGMSWYAIEQNYSPEEFQSLRHSLYYLRRNNIISF